MTGKSIPPLPRAPDPGSIRFGSTVSGTEGFGERVLVPQTPFNPHFLIPDRRKSFIEVQGDFCD